jgi:hypothetical protein
LQYNFRRYRRYTFDGGGNGGSTVMVEVLWCGSGGCGVVNDTIVMVTVVVGLQWWERWLWWWKRHHRDGDGGSESSIAAVQLAVILVQLQHMPSTSIYAFSFNICLQLQHMVSTSIYSFNVNSLLQRQKKRLQPHNKPFKTPFSPPPPPKKKQTKPSTSKNKSLTSTFINSFKPRVNRSLTVITLPVGVCFFQYQNQVIFNMTFFFLTKTLAVILTLAFCIQTKTSFLEYQK